MALSVNNQVSNYQNFSTFVYVDIIMFARVYMQRIVRLSRIMQDRNPS